MRKKIYDIIDIGEDNPVANRTYSIFMLCCIVVSLIPLGIKGTTPFLDLLDKVSVTIFIIDYFLRLFTADIKYESHSVASFVRYPFSPMAIIDLLSILPSLALVNRALKALRIARAVRLTRALRTVKTVRIVKTMRFSKSASILGKVIRDSKDSLIHLTCIAVGYILMTALIIFNVEPQTFNTFFDALYWATVSLTTVGYGDIYAVTVVGKLISMISSFIGIAIVALPSGLITAGFVKELDNKE